MKCESKYHRGKPIRTMLLILSLMILCGNISCRQNKAQEMAADPEIRVARQASEYEPQKAIWLIWPPANHTRELSNDSVTLELIKAIAPHQKVVITAATDSLRTRAQIALEEISGDSLQTELFTLPSE